MKVYGSSGNRTRRVLWTLEELGLPYVLEALDLRAGEHRTPEFQALNPNMRVPTVVDGDLVLFESAAIAMHIAGKVPESGLIPPTGTVEHARVLQWMFWVCTELEQPLWSMGKHRFALPRAQRIREMLETATWEWRRATPVLAQALEGREFLVGEGFTVADIFAAHTLLWGRGFDAPFDSPVLENYLDRMLVRPAFERTKSPPLAE